MENGKRNSLMMAHAPVIIALLLLAQFTLAAASFAPKFTLEINYASLEPDGPGNYSPAGEPPDFLPASAILLVANQSNPDKLNWLPASSNARVSTHGIRAPPRS